MESADQTPLRIVWRDTARWVVGGTLVSVLAWAAYATKGWVPVISPADLGIHELGHLLAIWLPPVGQALAGSVLEAGVPLGLALYFGLARRDRFAAALMTGWTGEALHRVAIYMADADDRVLPLLGGPDGHDWAYLFGRWGGVQMADTVAGVTEVIAAAAFVAALGLCVWGFVAVRVTRRKREEYEARLRTLPVREAPVPVCVLPPAEERAAADETFPTAPR